MKNIFLIFSIVLFVSCNSDDDSNNGSNDDNTIVNQYEDDIAGLAGNFYTITQLTVNGENKTMNFNGNTFKYIKDGSLESRNDAFTASGVYSYAGKTTQDSNEILIISFVGANPAEPFSDLNESWTITNATVNEVSLSYTEGASTKVLVFTKS